MADDEMDQPVTRRELRDELQQLEARFDTKLERLETRLEAKLEEKLEAKLEAKLDAKLAVFRREFRDELVGEMERIAKSLYEHFAAALKATFEPFAHLPTYVAAHEQRLAAIEGQDLPARVLRVEAKVLPSKRTRRRKATGD